MIETTFKYLRHIGVQVSKNYFEKLILTHPTYPSLLSISDVLERLGLHFRISRLKKNINSIEYPYLLYSKNNNEEGLILVKGAKDLGSIKDNLSFNNDIIIKAKPNPRFLADEVLSNYSNEQFGKVLKITLLVAFILLNLLPLLYSFTIVSTLLLVTAFLGTLVGYFLITKDIGIRYDKVESFCFTDENNNCETVLKSDAANIIEGFLTLSDLAASYFLFQLVSFGLIIPLSGDIYYYGVLSLLSALALPIVLYSLHYQFVQAKTICRLCLIIDGILISQGMLFGYMYLNGLIEIGSIGALHYGLLLSLFFTIISSLLLIKDKFKRSNRNEQREIEATRIKNSLNVFMQLLTKEKVVDDTPFDQELKIGNSETPINIIIAASLHCNSCKEGIEKAANLVKTYPEKVNLTIRLNSKKNNNNISSPANLILGYWLKNIHGEPDESEQTEKLFQDWFNFMDPNKFIRHYALEGSSWDKKVLEKIRELKALHDKWVKYSDIVGTPLFFINGYRLPPEFYRIDDMMVLTPALANYLEKKSESEKVDQLANSIFYSK